MAGIYFGQQPDPPPWEGWLGKGGGDVRVVFLDGPPQKYRPGGSCSDAVADEKSRSSSGFPISLLFILLHELHCELLPKNIIPRNRGHCRIVSPSHCILPPLPSAVRSFLDSDRSLVIIASAAELFSLHPPFPTFRRFPVFPRSLRSGDLECRGPVSGAHRWRPLKNHPTHPPGGPNGRPQCRADPPPLITFRVVHILWIAIHHLDSWRPSTSRAGLVCFWLPQVSFF